MPRSLVRVKEIRRADGIDDQKTAAEILTASSSLTHEEFQEYFLSQIKRIIFGNNAGIWEADFVAAAVLSLKELTAVSAPGAYRIGIAPAGPKDGVNRVFTTPEKFIHIPGGLSIRLYHNGRRLYVSPTSDPLSGDLGVSESGGVGTGFDTINFLTFSPRSTADIRVDYWLMP